MSLPFFFITVGGLYLACKAVKKALHEDERQIYTYNMVCESSAVPFRSIFIRSLQYPHHGHHHHRRHSKRSSHRRRRRHGDTSSYYDEPVYADGYGCTYRDDGDFVYSAQPSGAAYWDAPPPYDAAYETQGHRERRLVKARDTGYEGHHALIGYQGGVKY